MGAGASADAGSALAKYESDLKAIGCEAYAILGAGISGGSWNGISDTSLSFAQTGDFVLNTKHTIGDTSYLVIKVHKSKQCLIGVGQNKKHVVI